MVRPATGHSTSPGSTDVAVHTNLPYARFRRNHPACRGGSGWPHARQGGVRWPQQLGALRGARRRARIPGYRTNKRSNDAGRLLKAACQGLVSRMPGRRRVVVAVDVPVADTTAATTTVCTQPMTDSSRPKPSTTAVPYIPARPTDLVTATLSM
jgi:hypothetical protein